MHAKTLKRSGDRRPIRTWKRINVWSLKWPIFLVAAVLGFFDPALPFGRAVFASGLAMIVPIMGFRDFWGEGRFWITILLLGITQIPVVILMQPLMQQLRFPFMFAFGVIDCALMVAAVSWVCSRIDES